MMVIDMNWVPLAILAAWAVLGVIAPSRPGRHARHNLAFITRPAGPLKPSGEPNMTHRKKDAVYVPATLTEALKQEMAA